MRKKGRLKYYVLIPVLVIVFPVVLSLAMSLPAAGKERTQELKIPYPTVVAHRGASYYAPEETLPAYELALEMRVDYLEVDLQRSKDGVLFAFHDTTPERTTNAAEIFPGREGNGLEQFTWEELQRLDAGSWYNAAFPERARDSYVGLKIVRLEQVLDLARGHPAAPGVYIETKAPERFPGIETDLRSLLEKRGWLNQATQGSQGIAYGPARIIMQSFDKESLKAIATELPMFPRVYLVGQETVEKDGWTSVVAYAKEHAHGLGPSGYLGWPWYTGPAHRAGLILHHYTINRKWQMHLLSFFGSDGFFTDRPDLYLELLGRSPEKSFDTLLEELGY